MRRGGIRGFESRVGKVDAEASAFFAKKYFGEINFMTRSHTDKEQLSSMFAFLHTYLKYSGKLNMLDENKAMEDIMCEVLNRVYGWHVRGT